MQGDVRMIQGCGSMTFDLFPHNGRDENLYKIREKFNRS
jgi:hypothetical protein